MILNKDIIDIIFSYDSTFKIIVWNLVVQDIKFYGKMSIYVNLCLTKKKRKSSAILYSINSEIETIQIYKKNIASLYT